MRTRSQIIDALKAGLTSDTWKKLFNALLGKELLAYGAEVVGQSEQVMDTFIQSLDYKTASMPALISLANYNDICVSNVRPSFVRLRIESATPYVIYKPFDLKFTSGSATFTNINYCKSGDEVTLYQGVVDYMVTDGMLSTSDFLDFNVDVRVPYKIEYIPQSDSTTTRFLNLGAAMPESVYYIKRTNSSDAHALSMFTPLKYGSSIENYKLMTLSDGSIALVMPDGVWGKASYQSGTQFQIVWLNLTNNEFASNGNLTCGDNDVEYTLVASSLGKNNDLDYAHESYSRGSYNLAMISSKDQIRDYCNSYAYIFDSAIKVTGSNTVTVYVKPTDPSDNGNFGELESELDIHGSLFVKNSVTLGSPLVFKFIVSQLSDLSKKNEVESFLLDQYSYTKLQYNSIVDASDAAARVQSMLGYRNFCSLFIRQQWSNYILAYPKVSTVKIYNSGNTLVAYDMNGVLRGSGSPLPGVSNFFKGFGIGKYNSVFSRGFSTNPPVPAVNDPCLFDIVSHYYRPIQSELEVVFARSSSSIEGSRQMAFVSTTKYVVVFVNMDTTTNAGNVCMRILHHDMLWNYPATEVLDVHSLFSANDVVVWDGNTTATKPFDSYDLLGNSKWVVQPCRFEYYNSFLYYVHNVPISGTIAPVLYKIAASGSQTDPGNLTIENLFTSPTLGRQTGLWVFGSNLFILQESGYVDIIYNFESSDRQSISKNVSTVGFASTWSKITVFKNQDDEFLIITVDPDNSMKVYTATGIEDEAAAIKFSNISRVFNDGGIESSYFTVSYGSNSVVVNTVSFLYMNSNYIVLTNIDSDSGFGGYVDKFLVYNRLTNTSSLISKSSIGFFASVTKGMVDYENNRIILNDTSLNPAYLTYESQAILDLDAQNYCKLDESNPVIWK